MYIFGSSAQDQNREGSRLYHITCGAYYWIGDKIKYLLTEDNLKCNHISKYNFLNIGGGLGKVVAFYRRYSNAKCSSIEVDEQAHTGSEKLFNILCKKNKLYIPIIQIPGDEYKMCNATISNDTLWRSIYCVRLD